MGAVKTGNLEEKKERTISKKRTNKRRRNKKRKGKSQGSFEKRRPLKGADAGGGRRKFIRGGLGGPQKESGKWLTIGIIKVSESWQGVRLKKEELLKGWTTGGREI